jgi:steroid delta-isomerase-like uncharacterized protein
VCGKTNGRNSNEKEETMNRVLAVVGVCVAMFVASSARADDTRVAENWIEAWNSHDVEQILAVFTPDVMYEDVPSGVVNHGAVELRAFATAFIAGLPDFRLELVNASLKGGHGTIEWILSGTDVGLFRTGRRFSVRGASVIEVHGKLIFRNSDYYDLATIFRQIGLLPQGE